MCCSLACWQDLVEQCTNVTDDSCRNDTHIGTKCNADVMHTVVHDGKHMSTSSSSFLCHIIQRRSLVHHRCEPPLVELHRQYVLIAARCRDSPWHGTFGRISSRLFALTCISSKGALTGTPVPILFGLTKPCKRQVSQTRSAVICSSGSIGGSVR